MVIIFIIGFFVSSVSRRKVENLNDFSPDEDA